MRNVVRILGCAVLLVAAVVSLSVPAFAQMKSYQLSPAASLSQTVGLTDISVTYHRPGVKGRVIWGELVPYDKVWRAGANEATTVTFSDDVIVGGKQLKAGTYGFFVLPRKEGDWALILNAEGKQWGAFRYDSTKDVVRVPVKPEAAPNEERLSYSFEDLTGNSVNLVLRWEKVSVALPIDANTEANFTRAIKAAAAQQWQAYNNYAQYCLDTKTNWEKGMDAVEKSISLNQNPGNLRMKAELLAQGGKVKEAIETAEKAISVGKAASPNFNASEIEDLITAWKKK
ncbi:MAG TPA: DUF2911 domain-containing protein [Bacteroidota bacterium]|nr:DUF2911 domain-containing protein [Bacteroidota bacterium]